MILSNILYRTFFIKADQYGSAFTVENDGEEFLVTARHLLDLSQDHLPIQIFRDQKWHSLSALVVGHGRGEVDVSVLKLPQRLSRSELTIIPTLEGIALGQDVYFLGFPYKMWMDVGSLGKV